MPILELPCGIQVGPGRVERLIEVRKMSAKAQRDARTEEVKKNPALFTDSLIVSNVLKVGSGPALSTLKNEMLIADREWVSRQLRKITFGPTLTGTYVCKTCVALGKAQRECEMVHAFNIDDIPVKGLVDDELLWWDGEKAFKLEEPINEEIRKTAKTRVFEVANDKLKFEAVFRYPNGMDERKMAPLVVQEQEALAMQELLCRCLMRFNDKKRPRGGDGFGLDFFDELDLDVAVGLERAFVEKLPGPEKIQEIECKSGHTNQVELKSVDFLESVAPPT